jgi:hypothetical protein
MAPFNASSWQSAPLHRPLFYILRPGNQVVPLLPADELPHWLQVVQNFPLEPHNMHPASMGYFPRLGEYDIICLYCTSAIESLSNRSTKHNEPPSSGLSENSLYYRGYPGSAIFFFHHHGFPLQNVSWRPSWQEHDIGHSHTQLSRLNPRATKFNPVFGGSNIHYSSSGSNELASSLFSRKSQLVS